MPLALTVTVAIDEYFPKIPFLKPVLVVLLMMMMMMMMMMHPHYFFHIHGHCCYRDSCDCFCTAIAAKGNCCSSSSACFSSSFPYSSFPSSPSSDDDHYCYYVYLSLFKHRFAAAVVAFIAVFLCFRLSQKGCLVDV